MSLVKSKFYGLQFPIFGLRQVPYNYYISPQEIRVQAEEFSPAIQIDRFDLPGFFLDRYIALKEKNTEVTKDEFYFTHTCMNMTQLLRKKVMWCVDSAGIIRDLSKKQVFKAMNQPIIRTFNGYIWVRGVSRPFKLKKYILDTTEILNNFATVVYIDEVWHLYKITSFPEEVETIKI